jgi:peptidyl-prolyl cis-trans isomerase SurA
MRSISLAHEARCARLSRASLSRAVVAAALSMVCARGAVAQGATTAPKPPVKPAIAPTDSVAAKGLLVDGVAAKVGDQVILISEVLAEANRRRAAGAKVTSAAEEATLEKAVLEQLLEAELLVQKAKGEKVEVNDADVQKSLEDNEKKIRAQFKSESEFRAALKDAGFGTLEEWRKMQGDLLKRDNLQRDVMQKLKRDGKVTAVNVSESEVSEAFESNREKLPKKEARIGLRQIVIATKPSDASKARARAKIDSIRADLELHPGDFETTAKKESMDPGSRELGGDLGWNRRGKMVPEFDRIMFAMNPGMLSPVVETTFGFHIIRVDRVQPAEVKARHILIRPTLDSADEARARKTAQDVAAAWRSGASVDSLTVKYHDEAGGEEKTIPEFPRSELPEAYRNAIEGKKLGDIIDPFPIADAQAGKNKFVIAKITFLDEAGTYTLAEMRDRIRAQLSEERSMRRLIDSLKKQTFVSVLYDPSKPSALVP